MSVTIVVYDVNIYMLIMSHNGMASVKRVHQFLPTSVIPIMQHTFYSSSTEYKPQQLKASLNKTFFSPTLHLNFNVSRGRTGCSVAAPSHVAHHVNWPHQIFQETERTKLESRQRKEKPFPSDRISLVASQTHLSQ